ncbi:hypothetical protein EN851_02850 [Mesorhizobium sp. M8A.F.Ca.ET.208.01.1.1]|nr:hypothetical protein EN851_02850 [Mesorhizobium sp. M8A.F.Ca.ET.208.01.1.1]TGT55011.1 hypothetical protein EN810_02850 [Mesorhizobium sp. M8A.F.Ca.ET.167.01.1.1]
MFRDVLQHSQRRMTACRKLIEAAATKRQAAVDRGAGGIRTRRKGSQQLPKWRRTPWATLLSAAVDAARARTTVGEISDAMRAAFGDHCATPEVGHSMASLWRRPEMTVLAGRLAKYAKRSGIKPKVMVAKLGQDGHARGAKVIASAIGDIGFDVLFGLLFQTPQKAAETAIETRLPFVLCGRVEVATEIGDGLFKLAVPVSL